MSLKIKLLKINKIKIIIKQKSSVESEIKSDDNNDIGSSYIKIIPFLKPPYTHYCNNYPSAISILEDLKNENAKLV